jgi:hypothetical protein
MRDCKSVFSSLSFQMIIVTIFSLFTPPPNNQIFTVNVAHDIRGIILALLIYSLTDFVDLNYFSLQNYS